MIQCVGIALIVTATACVLKQDSPSIAFLLSVAAVVILLFLACSALQEGLRFFESLLATAQLDKTLYTPVIKAVGIAVVTRMTAALCRDAGQSAIAVKVEFIGVVMAMTVCVPLLSRVLQLVASLME